jgi:hypothetical protein
MLQLCSRRTFCTFQIVVWYCSKCSCSSWWSCSSRTYVWGKLQHIRQILYKNNAVSLIKDCTYYAMKLNNITYSQVFKLIKCVWRKHEEVPGSKPCGGFCVYIAHNNQHSKQSEWWNLKIFYYRLTMMFYPVVITYW